MLQTSSCRAAHHFALRSTQRTLQADASAAREGSSDVQPDKQTMEPDQRHSQHAMACQGSKGNLSGPFPAEQTDKEAIVAEAFTVTDADFLTISLLSSNKEQEFVSQDILLRGR